MTLPAFILGADPGLGGAIAVYCPAEPSISLVYDMPVDDGAVDAPALALLLRSHVPHGTVGVVEKVGSRPRQKGAFNFGLSTGIVHGALASINVPFECITPQEWKRGMGLLRRKDETQPENKSRARALAAQLFPSHVKQFSRVCDDGRAEALLLAVYYANRRKF